MNGKSLPWLRHTGQDEIEVNIKGPGKICIRSGFTTQNFFIFFSDLLELGKNWYQAPGRLLATKGPDQLSYRRKQAGCPRGMNTWPLTSPSHVSGINERSSKSDLGFFFCLSYAHEKQKGNQIIFLFLKKLQFFSI